MYRFTNRKVLVQRCVLLTYFPNGPWFSGFYPLRKKWRPGKSSVPQAFVFAKEIRSRWHYADFTIETKWTVKETRYDRNIKSGNEALDPRSRYLPVTGECCVLSCISLVGVLSICADQSVRVVRPLWYKRLTNCVVSRSRETLLRFHRENE